MSSAEWTAAKNRLVKAVVSLGYPEELGDIMAKDLGSLAVLFVTILNIAAWVTLFCVNCL